MHKGGERTRKDRIVLNEWSRVPNRVAKGNEIGLHEYAWVGVWPVHNITPPYINGEERERERKRPPIYSSDQRYVSTSLFLVSLLLSQPRRALVARAYLHKRSFKARGCVLDVSPPSPALWILFFLPSTKKLLLEVVWSFDRSLDNR